MPRAVRIHEPGGRSGSRSIRSPSPSPAPARSASLEARETVGATILIP